MKIAVPEHQGRVAPVFDTCQRILIIAVTPDGGQVVSTRDWSAKSREGRARELKGLGVEALLCGGITCWMEEQVSLHGIRLIPWLAGDVGEILCAFREGRISDGQYAMPGRLASGLRCSKRSRHRGTAGMRWKGKKGAFKCQVLLEQDHGDTDPGPGGVEDSAPREGE